MTKKILSFLLALIMVLALVPVSVFAQDDILSYLTYEINNGEVTITDCDEEICGDVKLPDTVEGYPVTEIDDFAFNSCKNITSVNIPEGVTAIGNLAFDQCVALESVTIPESVTIIGSEVFYMCNNLKNVIVDENNENYSSNQDGILFNKDKTKLIIYPAGSSRTEYVIPDSVRTIETSAFFAATNLKKIDIPDSVKTIGGVAFAYCYNLEEIIIPDSVTSTIGTSTFAACVNLKNVIIGNSVSGIESFAFFNCFGLENVEIGSGVTFIESYSFDSDFGNNLRSITIPENVEIIENGAFVNCNSLTEINILNPDTEIEKNSFGYTNIEVLIDYDKYISMVKTAAVNACDRDLTGKELNEDEIALVEKIIKSIIMYDKYMIVADAIIYGHKGSTAEEYANENGFKFVHICIHNYIDSIITSATYTQAGVGGMVCEYCGDVQSTYEIPMLETETTDDNNSTNGFADWLKNLLNKFIDAFMKIINLLKSVFKMA